MNETLGAVQLLTQGRTLHTFRNQTQNQNQKWNLAANHSTQQPGVEMPPTKTSKRSSPFAHLSHSRWQSIARAARVPERGQGGRTGDARRSCRAGSSVPGQEPMPGRTRWYWESSRQSCAGISSATDVTAARAALGAKESLRHQLAEAGRYFLNGRDTSEMTGEVIRKRIAWCPQEAHLFDSSLRANLLLARSREDAPSVEEMNEVLAWAARNHCCLARLR